MSKVEISKTSNFCVVSAFTEDMDELVKRVGELKLKGWSLSGGVSTSNSKVYQALKKNTP